MIKSLMLFAGLLVLAAAIGAEAMGGLVALAARCVFAGLMMLFLLALMLRRRSFH